MEDASIAGGEVTGIVIGGVPHAPHGESSHGIIKTPHANDVLLGRGGQINQHPGNELFRAWISDRKEDYILAKAKKEKTRISDEVFNRVKSSRGRFLTKIMAPGRKSSNRIVEEGGWWTEVDYKRAHSKISQCLREGAPALRSQRNARVTPRARTTRRKKSPGKKINLLSTATPPKPVASQHAPELGYANIGRGPAFDKQGVRVCDIFADGSTPSLNPPPHLPLLHMDEFTQPISAVAQAIPAPQTPHKLTKSEVEGLANSTMPRLDLERDSLSLTRNNSLSDHSFLMENTNEPFVNPFISDLSGDIGRDELNSGGGGVSKSLKQWANAIRGRSSGSSSILQ